MKKLFWIGLSFALLLLATILVAPAFIDLGIFKNTYLPLIEETFQRRVDVGEVRLALLPAPSIRLSGLKVSDGPAFPDNTFFAARQLQLRLKLWPLLRGHFEVTEFVLDQPVVNILKQPDGTYNYSDLAGKKIPAAKNGAAARKKPPGKNQELGALLAFVPSRLRINDGQLNLETKGQQPVRIDGIDLSLAEFAGGRPFPFRASFVHPELKTVSLEGRISYQEEPAALKLEDNHLKIRELDLPFEVTVTNLSTLPQVHLRLSRDTVESRPVFQILSALGVAPKGVDVSGLMGLEITVNGPANGLAAEVRGNFKDVRIEGKGALKGKLSGALFVKLPLGGRAPGRRMQGDGKLLARDGALTNADLIKNIQRLTNLIGLSKAQAREATTFKTLEAAFTVENGLVVFERVHLVNPQLEVAGGGTMTVEKPKLHMALETTLSAQASARAGANRNSAMFKDRAGRIVVPVIVSGPLDNPSVNLDPEKIAQRGIPRSKSESLGSFFSQFLRRR